MHPTLRLAVDTIRPPRGTAWHGGPTPLGTLRGVSARLAARTPPGRAHSIWELALHIAYWDYAVRRRLLRGERIPRFPRSPSNWPRVSRPATEAAWAEDRALLKQEQDLLVETIAAFPALLLSRKAQKGKRWTWGELISGIAVHDAYHAGQIQILKRLFQ